MESWVGIQNLVCCSGYSMPTLYQNIQNEVFNMQGA